MSAKVSRCGSWKQPTILQALAKSCRRHSLGFNLGDYDMDVNGQGAFSPPWNQEQMFGRRTGRRQSEREPILLTTHQTWSLRYGSFCQEPEGGNWLRIYLKTGKAISQTQRSPIMSWLFLRLFLWDWSLVFPTVQRAYSVNFKKGSVVERITKWKGGRF